MSASASTFASQVAKARSGLGSGGSARSVGTLGAPSSDPPSSSSLSRVPLTGVGSPFARQAEKAKVLSRSPNYRADVNRWIKDRDYDKVLNGFVRTEEMNYLQDKAYARDEGYAIGYVNGKKVMFVSGSRNVTDWLFNAADDFIPSSHHVVSNRTAKNLTKIAKANDVDVVVGHSRGGMLVSKMDIPKNKKLAVDGALRLSPKDQRDIMNLYQDQALDRFIARRGTNAKAYPLDDMWQYHFISRDVKDPSRYKGSQYGRLNDQLRPLRNAPSVYWDAPGAVDPYAWKTADWVH